MQVAEVKKRRPVRQVGFNEAIALALVVAGCVGAWLYWQHTAHERLFAAYFEWPATETSLRSAGVLQDAPLVGEAVAAWHKGRMEESLSYLEQYLEANPTNDRAALFAGVTHLWSGDYGTATDMLERVRGQSAAYGDEAAWYLVLAHVRMGQREEARRLLEVLLSGKVPSRIQMDLATRLQSALSRG